MSNAGIDEQQFNAISAFLKSLKSGKSLNASDLNMLNNDILGVFSNTYMPKYIGKTPEQLMSDHAPDFFTVNQTGDQMLMDIASDIANGNDIWTVKQNIKNILRQQPVGTSDIESSEYLQQADMYYNQWNSYKKAERDDAQFKIDNDPFRKNGLPGFDETYDPQQVFAGDFEKTAQRFQDARKAKDAQKQLLAPKTNTSEGGVRVSPDNPKYNPENYLNTDIKDGGLIDAIQGDKQNITDKDFLKQIKDIDKRVKMTLDDEQYAATYYRSPGLTAQKLAASLKEQLNRGLSTGLDPLRGGTGKERSRPYTANEKAAIQQYISSLEQGTPAKTKTTVASSKTPEGLKMAQQALQNPVDKKTSAQKGVAASGLSSEYEGSVKQAMIDILANKLATEGRTPLKDALTARGLVASSANTSKTKAGKNYTVKGSQVVPMGK